MVLKYEVEVLESCHALRTYCPLQQSALDYNRFNFNLITSRVGCIIMVKRLG